MGENVRPDPKGRLLHVGDWALDIPVPNPALQEWLNGPECEAALRDVVNEIYNYYVNYLPVKTGRLRAKAATRIRRAGIPGQTERWHGWVTNTARSYRKTRGKPYPRFIEYGKANVDSDGNPTGTRTPAGMQLRNAAYRVAQRRMGSAAAMAALGGMSGAGTEHHQARPAPRPKVDSVDRLRELAKAPQRTSRQKLSPAQREALRQKAIAEQRARMNANKKPNPPPG